MNTKLHFKQKKIFIKDNFSSSPSSIRIYAIYTLEFTLENVVGRLCMLAYLAYTVMDLHLPSQ